jgi:hypothetical protein
MIFSWETKFHTHTKQTTNLQFSTSVRLCKTSNYASFLQKITDSRISQTKQNYSKLNSSEHKGSCACVNLNTAWRPAVHTVFQNNTTIHKYLQLRSQHGSRNQSGPTPSFSHPSAERVYSVK